ncbi:hypothetical protein HDV04_004867 [Boothiomyces sp. JEL0838]|nr:hypothetical protein HDV04_004867 [Boothiomyces sp. JEL0838]
MNKQKSHSDTKLISNQRINSICGSFLPNQPNTRNSACCRSIPETEWTPPIRNSYAGDRYKNQSVNFSKRKLKDVSGPKTQQKPNAKLEPINMTKHLSLNVISRRSNARPNTRQTRAGLDCNVRFPSAKGSNPDFQSLSEESLGSLESLGPSRSSVYASRPTISIIDESDSDDSVQLPIMFNNRLKTSDKSRSKTQTHLAMFPIMESIVLSEKSKRHWARLISLFRLKSRLLCKYKSIYQSNVINYISLPTTDSPLVRKFVKSAGLKMAFENDFLSNNDNAGKQLLFKEGNKAQNFYIILSGKVELFKIKNKAKFRI